MRFSDTAQAASTADADAGYLEERYKKQLCKRSSIEPRWLEVGYNSVGQSAAVAAAALEAKVALLPWRFTFHQCCIEKLPLLKLLLTAVACCWALALLAAAAALVCC